MYSFFVPLDTVRLEFSIVPSEEKYLVRGKGFLMDVEVCPLTGDWQGIIAWYKVIQVCRLNKVPPISWTNDSLNALIPSWLQRETYYLVPHFSFLMGSTVFTLANGIFLPFHYTMQNSNVTFHLGDCWGTVWQWWLRWTFIQCPEIGWQGKLLDINLTERYKNACKYNLMRFSLTDIFCLILLNTSEISDECSQWGFPQVAK